MTFVKAYANIYMLSIKNKKVHLMEVPNNTPTPAQELGLNDKEFIVRRSSGELEQGWQIDDVREVAASAETPNDTIAVATISRPDDEHDRILQKVIPVADLQSWQPRPEDDGLNAETLPRERIQKIIGSGLLEQVVEKPIEVMGTDDTKSSLEEDFTPKDTTVAEAAERLGLPRESDPDMVEDRLREQMAELDSMANSLNDLVPISSRTSSEIRQTLSAGSSRLTGSSRDALNQYIEGPYKTLRALALDEQKLATMPGPLRRVVGEMQGQITRFGEQVFTMTGGNMPRGIVGGFDTESAEQVLRTLQRVEELASSATRSLADTEQQLTDVIGMKRANEEYEAVAAKAEKRPRADVFEVLERAEKTDTVAIRVKGELREELAASLDEITTDKLSDEELGAVVAATREKVASGEAEQELAGMDFMAGPGLDGSLVRERQRAVWLDEPIYIDPTKISGADGFESWMGRGPSGTGSVSRREGTGGTRSSIDQITDYASRDTPIPELGADGGLQVILANNGTFVFSSNAHRAAAAKLRGEPLPVSVFDIVRYDGEL